MSRDALLIVDPQVDFCPGGALAVPEGDRVIPLLNRAIDHARTHGWPVYVSRDWHPERTAHFVEGGGPWPRHCQAGTPGAAFHPGLRVPGDAVIVTKGTDPVDDGYSAFEGTTGDGTPLADSLRRRGVERIFVGGLATEYCVRASVLDALRGGFEVVVLSDAVRGIDVAPGDTNRAVEEMVTAGAATAATEDALAGG